MQRGAFRASQELIPGGVNSPVRAFRAVGRDAALSNGAGRSSLGCGRQQIH